MFPEVVGVVLGTIPVKETAILVGYQRFSMKRRAYPGLKKNSRKKVQGVLYKNLTPSQMRIIDCYEGDEYERIAVRVGCGTSRHYRAWVYVVKYNQQHLLSPHAWDVEDFARSKLTAYLRNL